MRHQILYRNVWIVNSPLTYGRQRAPVAHFLEFPALRQIIMASHILLNTDYHVQLDGL